MLLQFLSNFVYIILLLPSCYLLGSVMSAIFVARLFSLPDPRLYGSKNPGATNIARSQHITATVLTFLGDGCKGFIPVKCAVLLGYSNYAGLFLGFATVIGHMFPIFFNYRGGKGMATAFGVTLALSFPITMLNTCVWLFVYWISRISGLASVVSVCVLPALYLASPTHYSLAPYVAVFSILIVWMHGHNLFNIFQSFFGKTPSKHYYN
ncbi:MAG: glycerol-3-phosphate 1-O-acyltransferase PlsY [Pseudomonadota bacterium]|nr:glycerol-3-phosphate 1-O-acyltransferase PlsY [Pseudomonadota bacterium]